MWSIQICCRIIFFVPIQFLNCSSNTTNLFGEKNYSETKKIVIRPYVMVWLPGQLLIFAHLPGSASKDWLGCKEESASPTNTHAGPKAPSPFCGPDRAQIPFIFGPSDSNQLLQFFYFYIFQNRFFTEIYFRFHILQFYTPTARQGGGRDLHVNK